MNVRIFPISIWLIGALVASVGAQTPPAPKLPIVNDSTLKIELIVSYPEVEACTTVCAAPDGSFYVGNDPRDGRLSSSEPLNTIVRFSGFGPDRKKTVFADKIYSPAGSVWHDGWLYILHDPLLTRFKDTDGDGVADVREDLVTNLGIPPNEGLNDHVVSGFTLGMDGFFYISVGDRGIFQAKSAKDGSTISMQGGGIARCRTDGSQLEVYSTGTRNHLQVNLDAEDNAFTRDNTDDGNGWWTRLTHHVEGGFYGYPFLYRTAPNYGVVRPSDQTLNAIKQHGGSVDRTTTTSDGRSVGDLVKPEAAGEAKKTETFLPAMADFGGGSPTGGLCYLSDGLPEQYRGKHFFSEWGKAGIFVTEVARDGATFKLVSDTKLVEPEKGADFRPMQLSVAADGSLLIADWGYGGWKSPRTAGAIWRLSWPEAKPAARVKDESKASVQELIAALGHPDRDQRLRAQAALIHQGESVTDSLAATIKDQSSPELRRIHALWAFKEITCTPEILATWKEVIPTYKKFRSTLQVMTDRLEDPSPSMRIQAIRALAIPGVGAPKFTYLESDPDSRVRLQAAVSLGRAPDPQGSSFSLIQYLTDEDPWVRFSVRRSLQRIGLVRAIVDAINSDKPGVAKEGWATIEGLYAEECVEALERYATRGTAEWRARAVSNLGLIAYRPQPYDGHWWGTQPVKSLPPPNTVSWEGTSRTLAALSLALGDSESSVRLAAAKAFTAFILDAEGKEAGVALRARLMAESEPAIRRQLIESIGVQKDPLAVEVFRQIALDEKADPEFRETAIGAVVNIGGDPAKQTITQLAAAQLSPAATRKIITASGELKVLEAAPALIGHLKDEDAANREAAARALQQLGPKSESGAALIALLTDKDGKVQAAAVDALGSFRERAALPGIIALLEKKKALRETTGALANMPDESAIPVLVETLRDKNTTFRRNAIKALKAMREKAKPQVEALLASGRVPEELVPEIRNAFDSGAITNWKMIGVFENVWDAVHPPEKDALANNGVPNLTAKYHNAEGKDVSWIDVAADADAGRVDLEKTFKSSAMVCAYAYTEIEATEAGEAKLFTSADDEIGVWLNGQRILNQPGNHGYDPDKNETKIELRAGKNPLFVKIGNKGGTWVFHARIPGYENGKYNKPKDPLPDEKQRLFALAMKPNGSYANVGNVKNGEKLFFDQAGALGGICATCHTVNGKGGQIGPDLSAIAANYKRPDLITSIHEPSKTIALGFEQVMVETKGGETVVGALRQETADALTVVGADAQSHVVKKADVKTNTHIPTSLMPQGLTLGLKVEEFVDLVAYLESLKGK